MRDYRLYSKINSLLPKLLLVMMLYHHNKNINKTEIGARSWSVALTDLAMFWKALKKDLEIWG